VPQFPDETNLTVAWHPRATRKAPRSRGQADQWAKPPSKTIREAVEKGAERINILYNWRLDGKKADMPIEK
jgi:hypothetical protein